MKKEVKKIVEHWKLKGNESFQGMPVCPELVYRLGGGWRGWNDFLGVKPGSDDYLKNEKRDRLEDRAFYAYIDSE